MKIKEDFSDEVDNNVREYTIYYLNEFDELKLDYVYLLRDQISFIIPEKGLWVKKGTWIPPHRILKIKLYENNKSTR